ncbi:MAG: hypothetical protein KAH18_09165 [Psychromonas sp.]|nr:hypothetical protein [Psychromonas sp.]
MKIPLEDPYTLSKFHRDKNNLPHVSSGYRVYVGHTPTDPGTTLESRVHFIFHEFTHKVLDTTDFNDNGYEAYAKFACYDQGIIPFSKNYYINMVKLKF